MESGSRKLDVIVHTPLFREVFWHEYAKIPRHTSQNAITEGDFKCILTRNCEGTEQLRCFMVSAKLLSPHIAISQVFFFSRFLRFSHSEVL